MTPLRPEKQKKLNVNPFGDDENNDSDGNNGNAKKKQKRGMCTGDEDDDNEDIDDEEQLMYMQAVEDAKGELDQEQDGCESVCADENQMGVAAVPLQKRKASLASLGKSDQESNKKAASVVPVAVQPTQVSMSNCGNGGGVPSPKIQKLHKSACGQSQAGGTPLALGASASSSSVKPAGGKGAGGKGVCEAPGMRSTWSLCVPFVGDEVASCEAGKALATPSAYTKETQKAKWASEVVKLKPFIATLERLMTSGAKCTETEVKNSIKGIARCNAKLDRKLEYEEAASTAEEPTLSKRAASIKSLFEAVKALKDLSINAGKSGSIAGDMLKNSIIKVQEAARKITPNSNKIMGFPLHWVQACTWCTCIIVSSFMSISMSQ